MDYLADTVAIVRHLSQHPKLGRTAAQILQDADAGLHRVFLSGITFMEILYLSEAQRINVSLANLLQLINQSSNYIVVPVDEQVVSVASTITDVPELHDRVLAGTAKHLAIPILTPDPVFSDSQHVQAIW